MNIFSKRWLVGIFLLPFFGVGIVSAQSGYGPGVGTSPNAASTPAPTNRSSTIQSVNQASETYTISNLDGLQFRIIGEPETTTEVRVAGDGTVTLPYIGTVKLAGKTVAQARQYLYELYDQDYYVNPQIDLMVVSYAQRRVQVLGKVNRQGPVIFPPEEKMTLLSAISYAGGWSMDGLAKKDAIKLKRQENGTVKEYTIDATSIGADDWELKDGDTIDVPERRF